MGNASGREEAAMSDGGDDSVRSNGDILPGENHALVRHRPPGRAVSTEVMSNALAPAAFPALSRPPILISPQVPIAPLQRSDGPPPLSQTRQSDYLGHENVGEGVPTIITWNYGGNDVLVEGSWDSWTSRKRMQRSSKDYSILLVLPSGVYHYKFIIDGEYRYIPELPHISDVMGQVCNVLDIHNYMPENPESIAEFEPPTSPESSYSQVPSAEEDFAKEPALVPPHLHLTVLGPENSEEPVSSKPQHVVLNHLFIEKGRSSQSVVALGLTQRFESKYVTVVLYKPV